jgi:hypothetical protein
MGDFNSVVASDVESSERWPFHAFWSKDGELSV